MERVTPERNTQNYTVKTGDTLPSIARRLTGLADYSAIYEQNKDLIGSNPNNITAGMVLLVPGTGTSDDEW